MFELIHRYGYREELIARFTTRAEAQAYAAEWLRIMRGDDHGKLIIRKSL